MCTGTVGGVSAFWLARSIAQVGKRGRLQREAEEERLKLGLAALIREEREAEAPAPETLPSDPIPRGPRPHARAQWDEKLDSWVEWDGAAEQWVPIPDQDRSDAG